MERTEGDRLRLNVRMMPKRFQQVLLHVFSILSSTEVLFICQNLLEIPSNSGETNYTPELWSVVCCRFILRQITLEGTHHAFIRGAMSDYRLGESAKLMHLMYYFYAYAFVNRFWLISDAIVSRSILNEILGDLAVARADVMYVLRELSPGSIRTSSGISAPSGDTNVDMTDGSKGSIQSLPGPVRRLLLYSAARLPLLERDMGLAQESYKSFRHCIGGSL